MVKLKQSVDPIMDENQSDLALPDISEAEHEENEHENGDQVFISAAKCSYSFKKQ